MFMFRTLVWFFLMPGNLALSSLNIAADDDGGIFRSLINMIVWGFVGTLILLPMLLR